MATTIIEPIKVFITPENARLRLYDIDRVVGVPIRDLARACSYRGGSSSFFSELSQRKDSLLTAWTSQSSRPTHLLKATKVCDDCSALNYSMFYSHVIAIKKFVNFFKSEVLPFVEKWEGGQVESEKGQVERDKWKADREKALEDENAKLRAEIERLKNPPQKKNVRQIFGERLKQKMREKNLKIVDAVDALKIDKRIIELIFAGKFTINLSKATKIADYLDVSLDWLCGRARE